MLHDDDFSAVLAYDTLGVDQRESQACANERQYEKADVCAIRHVRLGSCRDVLTKRYLCEFLVSSLDFL